MSFNLYICKRYEVIGRFRGSFFEWVGYCTFGGELGHFAEFEANTEPADSTPGTQDIVSILRTL